MAGYCRQWVPDYAVLVRPLLDRMLDKALELVEWTQQGKYNFSKVKTALMTPALGLPDYDKTFYLYTHKRDGFAQAVLTQQHGDKMCLLAYYNTKLDPMAQGFSPCLRAVAAAASYAVQTTSQIVMTSPLVLRIPHCMMERNITARR